MKLVRLTRLPSPGTGEGFLLPTGPMPFVPRRPLDGRRPVGAAALGGAP
jgi:hypothetical protein